jgi:hypothetical protein
MDFDQYDFDKIIMEKIIPLIQQEKEKFVITTRKMNKENLDYIKYKFHDKDSEFYSWKYEILRDNDKSIILRLDINVLQKDIEQLITELYERHLYISLLLICSDEIANEGLVIGITEAELDKAIF